METKGITCKIPLDLHNRISEDIRESESTMSKFIEMVINEHYMKGANDMNKMRTMAFQVSEEFFQRIRLCKDFCGRLLFGRDSRCRVRLIPTSGDSRSILATGAHQKGMCRTGC